MSSDPVGECVPFSNVTYNNNTGELTANTSDPVATRMAKGSFRNIVSRSVMSASGIRNIDTWNESAVMWW